MKSLSIYERKNAMLGVLLMSGLICLYVLLTIGSSRTFVFRWFFPIFWLIYSIMLIVSILVNRSSPVYYVSTNWVLRVANWGTGLSMIIGYLTSVQGGMRIEYYIRQETCFTLDICILIGMYVYGVSKERVKDASFGMNGTKEDIKDILDFIKSDDKEE